MVAAVIPRDMNYIYYASRRITQLAQQVDQDEEVGQEASAVPGGVDVLALLPPLEPHADAVLQEGADQAESGHMGEVVLGDTQELEEETRKRKRSGGE